MECIKTENRGGGNFSAAFGNYITTPHPPVAALPSLRKHPHSKTSCERGYSVRAGGTGSPSRRWERGFSKLFKKVSEVVEQRFLRIGTTGYLARSRYARKERGLPRPDPPGRARPTFSTPCPLPASAGRGQGEVGKSREVGGNRKPNPTSRKNSLWFVFLFPSPSLKGRGGERGEGLGWQRRRRDGEQAPSFFLPRFS